MTFTPVLPSSGLTGWNFLKSTLDKQTTAFNASVIESREVEYFQENIGSVETLDDLMGDRRLLSVALEAFGLGDEIDKGAFVRKIIEEGTEDSSAFAVRLANSDYIDLAETFDFSSGTLSLSEDDVANIVSNYQAHSFEEAVGESDEAMRLALNFEREITNLAASDTTEDGGWFSALGSIPLRTVLESAFQVPDGFSALDIDTQKDFLADRSRSLFGDSSVDAFNDPENVETVIRRFLLQEQIDNGPAAGTPGLAALNLLQGAGSLGSVGIENLLISNASSTTSGLF